MRQQVVLQDRVRVRHHGPELQQAELAAFAGRPAVDEQDVAARLDPDRQRDQRHRRQAEDDQDEGGDDVERPLEDPPPRGVQPGRLRSLERRDVDELVGLEDCEVDDDVSRH